MKNPPAFPSTEEQWYDVVRTGETYHPGMTLRDYFAGQAIIGICVNSGVKYFKAETAYKIADAMLEEREK